MGPSVCNKLTDLCADLTDVTLADEDTNSILADNARAIQGNEAMQVMQVMQVRQVRQVMQVIHVIQAVDVIQVIESLQRRWPFLVANLELMQVVPSGGQICN